MDEVKRELAKLMSHGVSTTNDGAGSSSTLAVGGSSSKLAGSLAGPATTAAAAPRPTDISHLIKRKKPDEPNKSLDEGSPAKRIA